MNRPQTSFLLIGLLTVVACSEPLDPEIESRCERYAEHLADVIAEEKKADDIEIDAETRKNAVATTQESCKTAGLDAEQLDCALKAETTAAMRKCDDDKSDKKG